ncbi:helicase associated domain-containing protein [Arthrobacter sp. TB 26]|uniref:helicase associated domain-containing protein n=1 Tax=Arthrobacter sp. TB 26 TaxID=494420 RepID=UPI0004625475|nr:helicase associated domain-containing protein [Arthrobacter sp. TB 26]
MAREAGSAEWVIMYRKGLTPVRIAALCEVPAQKVTRALRLAKQRQPSLEEEHLANAPKPGPVSAHWAKRCGELARFFAENGRMPFAKGHGAESGLGRWLAQQRAAAARDDLPEEKRLALATAGDWEATPRAQLDASRWQERLDGLADYFASKSRFPRYRRTSSEAERALGTWLHKQRQKAFNGQLATDQLQTLNERVPGWNTWRAPRTTELASRRTSSARL